MNGPTFGELLAQYMNRAGISDSEMARAIGVQRQTIFRWKEGLVARPRVREDVLHLASKLRLTPEERDQLLLAAGFPPESRTVAIQEAVPTKVDPPFVVPAESPALPLTQPPKQDETSAERLVTIPLESPTPARPARRWNWLVSGSGILLAVVLGLVIWRMNRQEPLVLATPQPLPQTALPITSPTPTPPRARDNETLILIAQFTQYNAEGLNVAGRIQAALQKQITAAQLLSTTVAVWAQPIQDEAQARQFLSATRATILIWGEYDSGRVLVHWFTGGLPKVEDQEFRFTSPANLLTYVNEKVPDEMRSLALFTLGRLFCLEHAYAKAIVTFQQALSLRPPDDNLKAQINFYLGWASSQGGSIGALDKGIGYYSQAYQLNSRLYDALYNRGTLWINRFYLLAAGSPESKKSLDNAINDLHTLLHAIPGIAVANLNLGLAYYERNQPGDQQLAIQYFGEVVDLKPSDHRGWYYRALSQIRSGDGITWTTDLSQTLIISPTFSWADDAFCWGYALAQQPQAGLHYCTIALANQQDQPNHESTSHDALGIIYAQLGRYPEAIAELQAYQAWVAQFRAGQYVKPSVEQVDGWISQLQDGQNPFNEQLLQQLR
jgi:tetratricopeptide (TPR) repeat protein/transcriptional regulator with XRE-family HTH domain